MTKEATKWVRLGTAGSVTKKGVRYRNLPEWQRPCAVCGVDFVDHSPAGTDDPPTTANCPDHRGLTAAVAKGFLAWDGHAIVAGPKCGGGAPTVPGGFARVNAENGKYTVEGSADAARERDEAWARNIELMTEVGAWKRRYEDVFAELQLLKGSMPWSRA